jgi:hypothetical protein
MWHAVQQKQGRVKPTGSIKGNKVNRSAVLEKEADVMGARALLSTEKSSPLNSTKTNEPVAKVETREVKNVSNKGIIQHKGTLSDIYKENDRVVVAFLHKIGGQFNVAQREFMAINRNLIDSDKYYLMKRMDYESGKDRNALGEEYRAAREKYDSLSAILSLSTDIMKWSHVQIAKNKLAVTEEDIINNLDKIANNRAVFNTILMGLTVIMGSVNQSISNKINTKSISDTKTTSAKEPVKETIEPKKSWQQYETKYGGKQTSMKTTFNGKTINVRLDKPPINSKIIDFKHYNWDKDFYKSSFGQECVIRDFTTQIQKYKTIAPNVHLQFSQAPPSWAVKAIESAGGTYSVAP